MENFLTAFFTALLWAVMITLPCGAASALLHFLLSLPMNRRDRARFFLDLLETAIERGQSIEHAILSAAASHDRALGARFFMLAARIENGARFIEALSKEHRFLPPQINAMLHAGEKLGDLKKVLPACREVLRVAPDTVRATRHHMFGILFLFAPVACWIITLLSVFVIPKFKEVFVGMGIAMPPFTLMVLQLNDSHVLAGLELVLFVILFSVTVFYIGGPGLVQLVQFRWFPFLDWIAWRIPWKRKKSLRTFSAMLAVLLDGGVPEAEAVRLAGESTANAICRRRARHVIAALERGVKLDEAVRKFDDDGEFHWRLTNAIHAHGGFLCALRGWHEALDAKATRQEETATHIATSAIVILNGAVVALIAVGMFGPMVSMVKNMAQ